MDSFFFDNWMGMYRTFVIGVLAYFALIFFLRISGNRTLSKMNAFDFVVTVAFGSTLATVLLSKDVSLAEGALALGLLVGLQFVITFLSVKTRWVKKLVTGEPQLLYYQGEYLEKALQRARVNKNEIRAAVRSSGRPSMDDVEAVVLETDGSFSVVMKQGDKVHSSMEGVVSPLDKDFS